MSTKALRWWVRVYDFGTIRGATEWRMRWERRYVAESDARRHAATLTDAFHAADLKRPRELCNRAMVKVERR